MNINYILPFVFVIIVGYLFGSIPTGYLYCSSKNVNIFEVGSKNPGYTNVKRVLGKKHGHIVLVLDILKAFLPAIILKLIFPYEMYYEYIKQYSNFTKTTLENMVVLYAGMGAVIGHSYPIYLKFKGGKGIATTAGAMLSFNIVYCAILILIYKLVSKKSKYVSVGSITAVLTLSILSTILCILNIIPFNFSYNYLVLPACYIITIVCIIKHKSNIERLLNGTENKIV